MKIPSIGQVTTAKTLQNPVDTTTTTNTSALTTPSVHGTKKHIRNLPTKNIYSEVSTVLDARLFTQYHVGICPFFA